MVLFIFNILSHRKCNRVQYVFNYELLFNYPYVQFHIRGVLRGVLVVSRILRKRGGW